MQDKNKLARPPSELEEHPLAETVEDFSSVESFNKAFREFKDELHQMTLSVYARYGNSSEGTKELAAFYQNKSQLLFTWADYLKGITPVQEHMPILLALTTLGQLSPK